MSHRSLQDRAWGNIMRMSSFWGYFEESAIQEESDISLELQTQTRQREEPDQDTNNSFYRAIPSTKILFTKTLTEQREENDQDSGHFEYATFPFE